VFVADITRRRQGEMIQAVFQILAAHPDGLPVKDVLHQVEGRLTLTDFEQSDYPDKPGVRRFEKIVRFSTIASVKAGWLVKSKGSWIVTDDGRAALDKFKDPEDLMRESVRLYYAWRKDQPAAEDPGGEPQDEVAIDATVASITFEEAEETARGDIRTHLGKMPPYDFQELVAALLRAMRYHVAWVAPTEASTFSPTPTRSGLSDLESRSRSNGGPTRLRSTRCGHSWPC
jgi:restriction system protein